MGPRTAHGFDQIIVYPMGKSGQVDRIGIGPIRPGQGVKGQDFLPRSVEKVDLHQGMFA